MKKVIFIYGFTGCEKQARVARNIFSNYEFLVFNYNSWLKQSIKEISKELEIFINGATKKNEKVFLIGISAGGIIASYYSKLINPKKILAIATVFSPLTGTYLPKFYPRKLRGLQELRKGSKLLKCIKNSKAKVKEINFYSLLDPLVPGNAGRGKNPVHTWNFFHFTVQNDKSILNQIKRFFSQIKS